MKKILLLLLVTVVITGCDQQEFAKSIKSDFFGTCVYDSCEYIIGNHHQGYLAHKGNCKYCDERRKHELQNIEDPKKKCKERMIDITSKEYDAIIYAYGRLSYIADNNHGPEYVANTQASDRACVNVLDKMIDRINEMAERQTLYEQAEEEQTTDSTDSTDF